MHWQCSSLLMNYWLRHTLPVLQFSIIGMSDLLPVFPKHDKPTGQTLKLYEQIVIKNFQILKTILPKMNSLYQLNEQLQRSVSTIETRLVKMESDQENLHYEMRTSHLAIDSKLNSIILEYNNISNETNKVKKQTEMLTREIREAKSKHFIERSQKSQVEMPPEPIMHKEKNNEKVKKIAFAEKDQVFPSLFKNKSKTTQKNRRSSISLDKEDSPGKAQRVNFNIPPQNESLSEKRIAEQASENKISQPVESSRKTTFKSNKSSLHPSPAKSLREIKTSKSIQPINPADSKSFERFLKEIENYHFHNQKMKQNYEQLMQEYEKANQASFAQLNQKVNTLSFKLNELDPQGKLYDSIKNIINAEFGPKIDTITAAIEQKIDRRIFQKIMTDFNTRILGIHQQRKKTANRDQTKRALEFLQKKINGVLNDYYQAKQKSVHHVSVDKRGCLRTAGLLDEREPKDYNRDHLTQSQTATNTPRALRNDSSRTTKKQPASMHSRILNGTLTENRFNESEWKPIITEKGEVQEEAFTRRPSNNKKANLLKKKAYQLLDKEKGKDRPKLKKQRLIFQYD